MPSDAGLTVPYEINTLSVPLSEELDANPCSYYCQHIMHDIPPGELTSGAGSSRSQFLRGYEAGHIAARIELLADVVLRETIDVRSVELVRELATTHGRPFEAQSVDDERVLVEVGSRHSQRYAGNRRSHSRVVGAAMSRGGTAGSLIEKLATLREQPLPDDVIGAIFLYSGRDRVSSDLRKLQTFFYGLSCDPDYSGLMKDFEFSRDRYPYPFSHDLEPALGRLQNRGIINAHNQALDWYGIEAEGGRRMSKRIGRRFNAEQQELLKRAGERLWKESESWNGTLLGESNEIAIDSVEKSAL